MMKKILISALVACSLFVVSMSSVLAADETETITDDEDDVMDWLAENEEDVYVDNKPNIDIVEVNFSRDDNILTLALSVKGQIQNKGNLDNVFEFTEAAEYIAYYFEIVTNTETGYEIYYVNNQCKLWYLDDWEMEDYPDPEVVPDEDFNAAGSDLMISFSLKNSSEDIEYLTANVVEVKDSLEDPIFFADEVSFTSEGGDGDGDDDVDDDVDDDGDGDGDGDTGTDDSSNSNILLFVAAIGIIVVAGVAVVIYIIRR